MYSCMWFEWLTFPNLEFGLSDSSGGNFIVWLFWFINICRVHKLFVVLGCLYFGCLQNGGKEKERKNQNFVCFSYILGFTRIQEEENKSQNLHVSMSNKVCRWSKKLCALWFWIFSRILFAFPDQIWSMVKYIFKMILPVEHLTSISLVFFFFCQKFLD